MKPLGRSIEQLAEALRQGDPPVMGVLSDGVFSLDVRTVRDEEFPLIVQAMNSSMNGISGD